jgi:small conductance mechanosensitive channel
MRIFLCGTCVAILLTLPVGAQEKGDHSTTKAVEQNTATDAGAKGPVLATPEKVQVTPAAKDSEIATRLSRILSATEWFDSPSVKVDEGVVFLRGKTMTPEYREWASNLAAKTEDVVAVVNHIEVTERSALDFSPAWLEMRTLGRKSIQSLPMVVLSLVFLVVTFFAARATVYFVDYLMQRRMPSTLLRKVVVHTASIPVWLIGIYFVLRTSGLTQMALTVLGGTGLAGLIVGIAFQNIAENFLASLLISIQKPFQPNDFIEVAGFQGLVQRVTARGTVLLTVDGNHIQIPNATIYKSIIRNFSANPNARLDFKVGIGYDNATSEAQEIVLKVLQEHSGVLKSPEPLVLVEELIGSCVTLRIYFWIDARKNDGMKMKSSLLRLVKKALQDASVTLADPDREVIIPQAVAVQLLEPTYSQLGGRPKHSATERRSPALDGNPAPESGRLSCQAEGHLKSDEDLIKKQGEHSRQLESGPDLLASSNGHQ